MKALITLIHPYVKEAVRIIKERATAKFDETIEVSMNLNIDPRKSDQNIRGVTQFPAGTGKTLRVAVFAKGQRLKKHAKQVLILLGTKNWLKKYKLVR